MSIESIQPVAEHYQKTFELTYETWKERNRLFIYLVLTTGVGLLLLFRIPEANSLLIDTIAKLLSIADTERIDQLHSNFPIDVLPNIILVIDFYLMQKLYSANLSVLRYYLYLGAVEVEIRKLLKLSKDSVSFTREGKFYWDRRSIAQNVSKWSYVFVIFITLLPFMVLKITGDYALQNYIIVGADIIVSLLTLLYLWEYARSARNLDVPKIPVHITGKKS